MSRLHWINISTFASLAMIILNDYFNRIELLVFWWNEINNRCYIVHQEIIKRFSYSLLQKNLTTFSILRFCKKGQFWLSKFAKWPFIQLQSHDEFFEWIVATTFCTLKKVEKKKFFFFLTNIFDGNKRLCWVQIRVLKE